MAVEVIDKIKPKNGGSFPVVEAVDVEVSEGLRLPEALDAKANTADVTETTANLQTQIDEIARSQGAGTADTEIAQARVDADGTSYQTLKARLDAEYDALSSRINKSVAYKGKVQDNSITDINNAKTSGIYVVGDYTGISNLPLRSDNIPYTGMLVVMSNEYTDNVDRLFQLYYSSADNSGSHHLFFRYCWNGTWSTWDIISTASSVNAAISNVNGNIDFVNGRIDELISGGTNIDLTEYTNNIITATLLAGNTLNGSASNRTIWIECDANTKYIIDRGILNKYFGIATSEDAPVLNSTTINVIATDESKSVNHFEFTTPSNAKYLYIQFYHTSVDTDYTLEQILASISVKSVVTLEDVTALQNTVSSIMPYKGTLEANSITDLNNCTICGTYEVANYTGVQNMPIASTGLVIVFSNEATKTRMIQMFQSNNGTLYKRYLWTSNSGIATWGAWGKIISEIDIYDITPDFSLFENFGVIGDSYASGEIYIADESSQSGYRAADYYNLSWGQIIARKCGSTCTNFSKGGLTTETWLTDARGLALLQSETAKNIIVCCLGLNDASRGGSEYIGNVSDIGTDNNTFYANYGKIISAIATKSAATRIIMSTLPHVSWISNSLIDMYNVAIKAIALHFSVPIMDITDDYYYTSINFTSNMVANHPTAINYAGMAKANQRLLENTLINNPTYFKKYIG